MPLETASAHELEVDDRARRKASTPDRWRRKPPKAVRLAAGLGPPIAVMVTFLAAWVEVSTWAEAPEGDTNFLWMPAGTIIVGTSVALLGLLLALSAQTATQAVIVSVAAWIVPALLSPVAFVGDGFPPGAVGLMVGCAAFSLIPTLCVAGWAAFAEVDPPVNEPGGPAAAPGGG